MRLRSEMSRATFDTPMIRPSPLRTGEMVRETSSLRPSFAMRVVSSCSMRLLLDALALRDVPSDLRHADDPAVAAPHGRDGEGNVEPAAVLRDARRFQLLDALAARCACAPRCPERPSTRR